MGDPAFTVFVLRCLLNYHERMMAGAENLRVELRDYPEQEPPTVKDVYQGWADGLKEAIRCVMKEHAGKVMSFSEWDQWVGIQEEKDLRGDG